MITQFFSFFRKKEIDLPGKFYVSWVQDYGWAASHVHGIITAISEADAKINWESLLRHQGYRCNPAYSGGFEQLFRIPPELLHLSNKELLDYFKDK